MNSDNNMNNTGNPNNNNPVNDNLPALYNEEIANILHNDDYFNSPDTMLGNEPQDIPTVTTQTTTSMENLNTLNNNNNNNNNNKTVTNNDDDDLDTINITNPNTVNTGSNNNNNTNFPYTLQKRRSTQRSTTDSATTDNTSSGTVEDIINPSFMKPNQSLNNKERSLMLARDAKANIRHLMRRGSPLGMFNTEQLTQNEINNILNNHTNTANNNTNTNNSNNNNNNMHGTTSNINGNNNSNSNNNPTLPNRNTTPLYSSDIARNSITPTVNYNNNNVTTTNSDNKQTIQHNTNTQRRHNPHKTRPAFVNKLWSMVNDINNKDLIQWAGDGKSFIVTNRESFVHNILPRYFKHSNFASFVRQLNMYGWHKVQDVKSGSIQGSSDDRWQFANENFEKDREDLLINIVRQRGGNHHQQGTNDNNNNNNNNNNNYSNYNINQKLLQNIDNIQDINDPMRNNGNNYQLPGNLNPRATLHITNGPESIQIQNNIATVLNELEQIKYNQIAISKDLIRVNKDNDLLWKENMMARERYRSQQQILEKIFRFMAAMMPHMDQKMIMDGIVQDNDMSGDLLSTNTGNNHNNTQNNKAGNNNNTQNNMDRNNSMFNGMINYDNINPQVISPSEKSDNHHGVYLETLEDIDNSPPGSMSNSNNRMNSNNNNNNNNNGKINNNVNDRFLLKNKTQSPENVQSSNNNNKYNNNNNNLFNKSYQTPIIHDNSNNKISELPFSESDDNVSPIIQEVKSTTTSPQLNTAATDASGNDTFFNNLQTNDNNNNNNNNNNTNNNNDNNNNITDENINNDINSIRQLQNNIEEQNNRIRNLGNMVTHLTPKLMSPMTTNASTTHHSQQHSNDNKNDLFNFQDYFNQPTPQGVQTPPSHQHPHNREVADEIPSMSGGLPSGLTPLMMEDPSLLTSTNDLTNDANGANYNLSTPQIEELNELNDLQHNHNKRRVSSSSMEDLNHKRSRK